MDRTAIENHYGCTPPLWVDRFLSSPDAALAEGLFTRETCNEIRDALTNLTDIGGFNAELDRALAAWISQNWLRRDDGTYGLSYAWKRAFNLVKLLGSQLRKCQSRMALVPYEFPEYLDTLAGGTELDLKYHYNEAFRSLPAKAA